MLRFRKQITLANLMLVTPVLGLNFAYLPWPASLVGGIAILLPVFVSGFKFIDYVWIFMIVGVLVGLLSPPVVTHGGRNIVAPPAAGGSPGTENPFVSEDW